MEGASSNPKHQMRPHSGISSRSFNIKGGKPQGNALPKP